MVADAVLDELYVLPAQRRRGIGTVLLHAAETACRRRGAGLLEVNVDSEDEAARRFYERHGYANREPNQAQPQLYYFRELPMAEWVSSPIPDRRRICERGGAVVVEPPEVSQCRH